MRLVAWMLIIVSLVLAIVSAVTSYLPKTSLADESLRHRDGAPLTLAAPAGKVTTSTTAPASPIARAGEPLTPELLAQIRAVDQRRVRVKEFSFARWSEWWVYALGCAGMLIGAMLIRRENARQFASGAKSDAKPGRDADQSLKQLRFELAELLANLAAQSDPAAQGTLIIDRAERIVSDNVPPFIDARPKLVGRLGLAGYAQLMDHFAAGERKLNRAWSAAADGYVDEAIENLDLAAALFDEAEQRLNQ